MAGFEFAYTLSGAAKRTIEWTAKASAVFTVGELAIIDTGEADVGVTNGTYIGATVADVDNTADGLTVFIISNPDAVYRVTDLNARTVFDALDVASGGLGVTTKSNDDLKVVANSTATEPTLVMFNNTHYLQEATT